jgi:hypothetical protein
VIRALVDLGFMPRQSLFWGHSPAPFREADNGRYVVLSE